MRKLKTAECIDVDSDALLLGRLTSRIMQSERKIKCRCPDVVSMLKNESLRACSIKSYEDLQKAGRSSTLPNLKESTYHVEYSGGSASDTVRDHCILKLS